VLAFEKGCDRKQLGRRHDALAAAAVDAHLKHAMLLSPECISAVGHRRCFDLAQYSSPIFGGSIQSLAPFDCGIGTTLIIGFQRLQCSNRFPGARQFLQQINK
jgi:hypothetical protein